MPQRSSPTTQRSRFTDSLIPGDSREADGAAGGPVPVLPRRPRSERDEQRRLCPSRVKEPLCELWAAEGGSQPGAAGVFPVRVQRNF